jgi:hypothetical protein
VSAETADTVVALRKRFPHWGPRKLLVWLQEREPTVRWPAASTIGALLKQRGMIKERRRRIRTPVATQALAAATEPNVLWCDLPAGQFGSIFLGRLTKLAKKKFSLQNVKPNP